MPESLALSWFDMWLMRLRCGIVANHGRQAKVCNLFNFIIVALNGRYKDSRGQRPR